MTSKVVLCALLISLVIAASWAIPADVIEPECAEWEEVDDGTEEIEVPEPSKVIKNFGNETRRFFVIILLQNCQNNVKWNRVKIV